MAMTGHSKGLTVLHVDTERGWRGGERQAVWLARELVRLGARSIVAGRSGEPLLGRASEAGLATVACDPWGSGELDVVAALRLRGVVQREGVDIVHAHSAHAVTLGAMATLGTAARMVVTRRVDFPLRANVGTRWKYGRAAVIIAISGAVERVLVASGVPAGRVTVIPSGIDLSRVVEPTPVGVLEGLGVPPGAPLVVQVAQLVGHKDPLTFVAAMATVHRLVPEAHAIMVGDGFLADAVRGAVREAGLEGVVHVAGYRTDADQLIAAARVVTLSSREEGMGTVLLDAMAFGGAIAATVAGGIPEVVSNRVDGLLVPIGDGPALGAAIGRLLTEPGLAERLQVAARLRVRDFSVAATAARTLDVYRAVARGFSTPS
jgi:glycosyltransferase involved in cell wall biosynthesis